ncbi:hypothetical protein WQQ_15260 [Hydrocarboniphaga effusa AP103]|uniref:Uncharacterized protein n=1 Tax=Hydrocarboniphaga effusa AP103 TaxID=1172194 RepID=I7ZHL2_9GAMM|nr:hypothetical protein WQQ_15260 [Hydrocarboniphaga effusa AP103]
MKPQITARKPGCLLRSALLQRSCGMKPQITAAKMRRRAERYRKLQRSCGMKPQITTM